MATTIAQYINQFASAVAALRVAEALGEAENAQIEHLLTLVSAAGWQLRDLGIDVQFDLSGRGKYRHVAI